MLQVSMYLCIVIKQYCIYVYIIYIQYIYILSYFIIFTYVWCKMGNWLLLGQLLVNKSTHHGFWSVFFIFFFGILIFKQIASHLTATSLRDAPPLSVDLMLKVLPLSVTMAAVGLLECLGRRRRMKIYEGEIRCEILSIRRLLTSCYLSLVYLRCI